MKKTTVNKTISDKKQKAGKQKLPALTFWQNKTFLFHLFIVLAVTAIVFSGSLKNAFVNWDDDANLLENPNMLLLNWKYIKHIFTDPVIGNYNPLPILTFAIEHHYFGFNPYVYHFDNLLLHLICTFLVYRIFIVLNLSPVAALIGALLFGIHPMRVESVAWVTERKDVLFGVFYLSALFLYIKNRTAEKPRLSYTVAIAVLFVLSLFSKIQAVSLPLTMLVIDFYLDKKLSWKIVLQKTPYFIFSILFGIIGFYFLAEQKSLQQATNYTFLDRILVGCLSYILYIIKFVVPYRMSPMYPYDPQLTWDFYVAPLGILATALLVFLGWRKKWYWLLTGLGLYTVNIIFLLQIVGAGQGLFADRFTYIPYLGLIFLVIYGVDYIQKNSPQRKTIVYSLAAIYLLFFSVISWEQIGIWKNGATLWTHVLEYYPKTTTPWQNRARYYRDNKQYDLAMADLTAALALRSDRGTTYNSRAKLYFDTRKYKEAISDYDSSIIYKPGIAEVYINRGVARSAIGDYENGIADITRGIDMKPEYKTLKNAYLNLSQVYSLTQQYEKSIETYDKLLALDPTLGNIWYEKALCERALGKEQEAVAFINKAIEIGPPKGLYYNERAKAWYALGEKEKSRADVIMAEKSGVKVDERLKALLYK